MKRRLFFVSSLYSTDEGQTCNSSKLEQGIVTSLHEKNTTVRGALTQPKSAQDLGMMRSSEPDKFSFIYLHVNT
uniref:Uncharacterized protein n=1 Tax=Tanacetum cinerariifolium TaxID=118510 RepID=A0A6L2NXC1_TANCI|nr:hypothetical protein [Tanacetum cinerariifolium]